KFLSHQMRRTSQVKLVSKARVHRLGSPASSEAPAINLDAEQFPNSLKSYILCRRPEKRTKGAVLFMWKGILGRIFWHEKAWKWGQFSVYKLLATTPACVAERGGFEPPIELLTL